MDINNKDTEKKKKVFNFDFKDVKFQVNWASGITIVTLLAATITFYIQNKTLKESNSTLKTTVRTLEKTVATLEGTQKGILQAIGQVQNYSPSLIEWRLRTIEGKLNISFSPSNEEFTNAQPPSN